MEKVHFSMQYYQGSTVVPLLHIVDRQVYGVEHRPHEPTGYHIDHVQAKHADLETNSDIAAGSARLPRLGGGIGQQGRAPWVHVEVALRALVHVAPHGGGYLADVATPAGAQVGECEQVILLRVLVEGDGFWERQQTRLVDVEIALVAAVVEGASDYTRRRDSSAPPCTLLEGAAGGRRRS
jgi:hypothetical protein